MKDPILPRWLEQVPRYRLGDVVDRFQRWDRTLDYDDEYVKLADVQQAAPEGITTVCVEGHEGRSVAGPCCLSGCQYGVQQQTSASQEERHITDEDIVTAIGQRFRTFGGGHDSDFNPLARALKYHPLQFAAGVHVDEIVRFVRAALSAVASPLPGKEP